MGETTTDPVVRRASELYEQRLRSQLEVAHHGEFVSIEPESGDFFVARTLLEAIRAARKAHPDRQTYTVRIGYPVVVEIGNSIC